MAARNPAVASAVLVVDTGARYRWTFEDARVRWSKRRPVQTRAELGAYRAALAGRQNVKETSKTEQTNGTAVTASAAGTWRTTPDGAGNGRSPHGPGKAASTRRGPDSHVCAVRSSIQRSRRNQVSGGPRDHADVRERTLLGWTSRRTRVVEGRRARTVISRRSVHNAFAPDMYKRRASFSAA